MALSQLIDGGEQIPGNGCLDDVAARTGIQSLPHHFRGIVLTKNQDIRDGENATDFAGGFEAIEPRHADVHDHQVGI